ncbi:glycosyltransferase family 2 protein [Rhodococcus opacus]|uniref:glycosyltransferase family 2 protein n=1 Tax=Rhodococcus opacus TaxID=37919 RepID=UPI001B318765|nr:glycosyltransferase family 2 protein [Rhodococcus opacus]UNN03434.1 glycosyltransferase family 2 protein [Rhodococcus opacus]
MLDIIVVTYGSARNASDCLESMLKAAMDEPTVSWIFVDNTPTSTDADFLVAKLTAQQNVQIIRRPDNPGFAAGCNEGVRNGRSSWIAFMNPDLEMNAETVRELANIVGTLPDGAAAVALRQRTRGFVHEGIHFNRFGWFVDRPAHSRDEIYGPSGGAGLVARDVFESLGGFREDLFAWGEDAEFALRMVERGHKTIGSDLRIEHRGGHSFEGDEGLTLTKNKLLLRNRFDIAARHYSLTLRAKFMLFATVVTIAKLPRYLASGWAGQMSKVYFSGVRNLVRRHGVK